MDNSVGKIQINNKEDKTQRNSLKIVPILYVVLLLLYLFFAFVFPFNEGYTDKSVAGIIYAITTKCAQVIEYIYGSYNLVGLYSLIKNSAAVLVGASLAVAGAIFQGEFKNVLASPNTLGVTSGAVLGNAVYLIIFIAPSASVGIVKYSNKSLYNLSLWIFLRQQIFSFIGSMVAIIIILVFYKLFKKIAGSNLTILFGGMAVSAVFTSVISIIEYTVFAKDNSDDRLKTLMSLNMGTLDRMIAWKQFAVLSIFTIPIILVVVLLSNKLNVLSLGNDEAISLGINISFYKAIFIICGCIIVSTVVAFCGQIGLIGFLAPVIARKIVGNNMRNILIASIPLGAILLLVVVNVASALNLSGCVGVVSSALGFIIMFLYLFIGRRD